MKKKTSLLNITLSMIKCGLRTRLWTIPAVIVSLYIVLWFLRGAALPDGIGNTLSAGVFMLFRGDMPYMIGSGGDFKLPIVWLSANAFIAFTLRTFPIEISMLHEHKTMLGSVSKKRWWTAKFITMWVLVSFEFVLIYTAAILFSGINSNSLAPGEYFIQILLAPWLTSLAMSSVQILLNLVTKPIISLAAVIGYLTASAYYYSPIMIGNYSILQRSAFILSDGIRFPLVMMVTLSVVAICYIVGLMAVKKIDLL